MSSRSRSFKFDNVTKQISIAGKILSDGSTSTPVVLGNLSANTQSNITAVGTLSSLTVTGNISAANYNYANGISILASIVANAGSLSGQIVAANTALKGYVDAINTTLTSNAAVQAGAIATLTSNAAVQAGAIASTNTAITTANTAMKGYVDAINSTLTANAGAQSGAINTANTAMKGYVDGQITNLVNGAPSTLDTLNELAAALGNDANLSVTLTSLISNVQSNVTTANTAMKGYVDAINSTLTANLGSVSGSLATLTSNAAVQAGDIATLLANAGAQAGSLATLTSNAAVQAGNIATIFSNLGAVSGSLATLTSNAAVQAGNIATIFSNLGAVSGSITTLTSNAAVQSGQIVTANTAMKGYVDGLVATLTSSTTGQSGDIVLIYANLGAVSGSLATLTSNAGAQAGSIATLTSNAAVQAGSIADLIANAGAQAGSIATLTSNAAVQAGNIATLFANAGAQAGSIASLTSNAAVQAGDIATLFANAGAQSASIASLNTNKANLSGATFTGAVNVPELFVSSPGGDEGGQLNLAPAVTNTTLAGNVVIDVFQNKLRIFEGGGTARGGYFDISGLAAGVATNLAAGGGGGGTPGGTNAQIQFNNSSTFGGALSLYYFSGNGVVLTNAAVQSTSTTTGALQVSGGIGVAGNVWCGQVYSTNNGNGTNYRIGDDAWLGDVNVADTAQLMGAQNGNNGYLRFGNVSTQTLGRAGNGALTWTGTFSVGNITANSGSITAPAITTVGDTNTGMYFPSADTVAFTTGGNHRFRITSTGLIIGSEFAPVNGALAVYGAFNQSGGEVTLASSYAGIQVLNNGTSGGISNYVDVVNGGFFSWSTVDTENGGPGTEYLSLNRNGLDLPFGNLRVGSGSASLPSITNRGDINTGIFFPTEDTIAFTEGGVESMRINSSGNVGIGNTNPLHTLSVSGSTNITGNITAGNINSNNHNYANGTSIITTLSTAITTANTAMKGYVDAINSTLTANAGAQAGSIATLTSNAAVQSGNIATIYANLGAVSGSLATLTSNAAAQAGQIVTANTAMKGYVDGQISGLINSAPGTLDTLNEIALALGNDANLSATLTSMILDVQTEVSTANTAMRGYVDLSLSSISTSKISDSNSNVSVTADYINVAINSTNVASFSAVGFITTGDITSSGQLFVNDTTPSTSTSTGALTVTGGAGIAGNVNAGNVSATNLTGTIRTAAQPSITSLGTLTGLTVNGTVSATTFSGAGTSLTGTASGLSIGGSAPAGSLTGATLASGVTASSLTSVGTLGSLIISGWRGYTDADRNAASATYNPNASARSIRWAFVNASSVGSGGNYAGILQFNPWDGTTASTGDASYQMVFGSTAANSGGVPQLRIRKGIDTTWNSFFDIFHSGRTNSPAADNTYDLGASGARYATVYGVTFSGVSTTARYADLAENYTSDKKYVPGTVVIFGGTSEVTVSLTSHDTKVAGVVSTNPAYLMNSELEGVAVALQGRVPCRVLGPVVKGDRVVTSDVRGVAERLDMTKYQPGCIIGKALESVPDGEIATIEVVVGRV